jgi:hypothetical protein
MGWSLPPKRRRGLGHRKSIPDLDEEEYLTYINKNIERFKNQYLNDSLGRYKEDLTKATAREINAIIEGWECIGRRRFKNYGKQLNIDERAFDKGHMSFLYVWL